MDKISASDAKQAFGSVLQRAASGPVAIEKHGKVVAAVVPPDWLARAGQLDERRQAREAQRLLEQARLMAHQRAGIALLSSAERRRGMLKAAKQEVRRWAANGLCSRDYIERWDAWLALPPAQLVERMCSDAQGWGSAMRQNSPFALAP